MADERNEEGAQETRAGQTVQSEQPRDERYDESGYDDPSADKRDDRGEEYVEPAPELGQLHRDYSIPGVNPSEPNPYRWHTGEKRDHGGEDAIEIIDLVKQFGRTRILNGHLVHALELGDLLAT